MNNLKLFIFIIFFFGAIESMKAQQRPNIILIMSDDMGYSDIGCYGSEIKTPVLDGLAKNGLRYTQFYNQARCCPTRASLMTGLYPHQAGMGWMDAVNHNLPGYQGQLNNHCLTIAQVLKSAGYNTYMVGKWHLQNEKNTTQDSPNYDWPLQRGFDKFYGILKGASNFYDPGTLCRGNTLISAFNDPEYPSTNYYFTNALSDNAVKYIKEDDDKKPFFIYVAYTAAHWPMQAPEEAIAKYKGKYDEGWEILRQNRLKKMKQVGVIGQNINLSPLDARPWAEEEDKIYMTRRMETYAAMIEIMDQGIGKIVDALKKKNEYENTIILFLEDNGGNAEGYMFGGPNGETIPASKDYLTLKILKPEEPQPAGNPGITRDGKIVMQGKKVMAGPADTYLTYLKPWAQVSNTPFKEYKHFVHEGGIATPLIVHWPAGINKKDEIRTQIGNVIDIMPTLVDLAGATYPKTHNNEFILPIAGESLVPTFSNKALQRKAIFWEHEMNKAVRMGKWKLVSTGEIYDGTYGNWKYYKSGAWELYNMDIDRSELTNLAGKYPEIVRNMVAMWNEWTKKVPVYPTPWKEVKPSEKSFYANPL